MMPAFPFEVQAFFYAHHFSLYLFIHFFRNFKFCYIYNPFLIENSSIEISLKILMFYRLRHYYTIPQHKLGIFIISQKRRGCRKIIKLDD